jgi:hypothetical protein
LVSAEAVSSSSRLGVQSGGKMNRWNIPDWLEKEENVMGSSLLLTHDGRNVI